MIFKLFMCLLTSCVVSALRYPPSWTNFNVLHDYDFNQNNLVVELNEPRSMLMGHIRTSVQGRIFYAYEGIPYAQPPVGQFRFAEPSPHPGWYGVLNATENNRACVQPIPVPTTEDCLVLNVYSPVKNINANLPVFFWIHGGGYLTGSGTYNFMRPNQFMDNGIVIVTINYRLGPLGFLTTEDGVIPGNLGMKDQVLALRWVQKNIAVFGGDPRKVTIGGQSAGSTSVSFHILSPQSSGLFRGAILQSGSSLMKGGYVVHARNYSFQVGKYLNNDLVEGDSWELLNTLRSASVEDIQSASQLVESLDPPIGGILDLTWGIVVEDSNNPNAFINQPMHESFISGQFNRIPMLTGFNSQESLFFMRSLQWTKEGAAFFDEAYSTMICPKWHVPEYLHTEVGKKLKEVYTNTTFLNDLAAFVEFSSDTGFKNPIIREAELAARFVPVYMYEYSYRGLPHMIVPVAIPEADGATHGEEMLYMWGANFQNVFSEADKLISRRLMQLWTNFVRYQNPTPYVDGQFGIPSWQPVNENYLAYLDINYNMTMKVNPKHYLEYKNVLEQSIGPPFVVF